MTHDISHDTYTDQLIHTAEQPFYFTDHDSYVELELTVVNQNPNIQFSELQVFYQCSNLFVSRYALNNLIASAMPIITLINRIDLVEDTYAAICSFDQLLTHELQAFESQCYKHAYEAHTIRAAIYSLCAFIDDFIYNGHLQHYYSEHEAYLYRYFQITPGREQLTRILDSSQYSPLTYVDMLELIYLLFSMGYEGSFNTSTTHFKQRLKLMDELYQQIQTLRQKPERAQFSEPNQITSNDYQSISRPYLPLSLVILTGINLLLLGTTIYGLLS